MDTNTLRRGAVFQFLKARQTGALRREIEARTAPPPEATPGGAVPAPPPIPRSPQP